MKRAYFLLFFFIIFSGCAHVISEDLRAKADSSLAFNEVFRNPSNYKGKTVIWGGEIIQAVPQEDGTNLIEVLEWPLGWREKPRRTVSSLGKFLVLSKEPLDLSLYKKGTKITVAGEIEGSILGEEIKSVSDLTYHYPLLLEKQIHAWKHSYQYSTPYPPQFHDPSYGPRGMGILRY